MPRIGLRFDMRWTGEGSNADRYRAALDMAEWADDHGFDYVRLNEHHASADSYLPSPLVMAGAVGARTRRLAVRVTVLLLPLHDPLRVAEDVAVADLISGGRLEVVLGAGYSPAEFEMFGKRLEDRAGDLESGIEVLRKAWTGEPFEYAGRQARVTPRPAQDAMKILLGGTTNAGARRAARLADGFEPTTEQAVEVYERERRRLGRENETEPARPVATSGVRFLHVAEDVEKAWHLIGPHAMRESNSYAQWVDKSRRTVAAYQHRASIEDVRASGTYLVVDPDQCVDYASSLGDNDVLEFHPLMGGLDPEVGWAGLRLFAERVQPRLRSTRRNGRS
ncbi:LLM class flavin-dependent oxidoreductase [Amycolatopsis sp. GM8]|uniref:LLM class flavin-dependent oxidoreductase n=1 Tax=Amycolatopsis sp. GM8 TaxID=2896530 RepID=UPI001F26C4F1|nr:LLM class flavin-dependent oxidoreductase [Amycolatopsis sp. GM8]